MLLTITLSGPGAAALPQILNHPANALKTHALPFGEVHVFFPKLEAECQAAILLEVDPGKMEKKEGPYLETRPQVARHFNERPFAANSLLGTALLQLFGDLLQSQVEEKYDISLSISSYKHSNSSDFEHIFGPMGYACKVIPLEGENGSEANCYQLDLRKSTSVQQAMRDLITSIVCLDEGKFYWNSPAETAALTELAAAQISKHPKRELLESLLTKGQDRIFNPALKLLSPGEDLGFWMEEADAACSALEASIQLQESREYNLLWLLEKIGPKKVLDLGCGDGHLLYRILVDGLAQSATGMDISTKALQKCGSNLVNWGLPSDTKDKVSLFIGSACYRDERMDAYDTVVLQELLCHLEEHALRALIVNIFDEVRPAHILLTMPNSDYNPHIPGMQAGQFRHANHRFEWGAEQIAKWAENLAANKGYSLQNIGFGGTSDENGPASFLLYFNLSSEK